MCLTCQFVDRARVQCSWHLCSADVSHRVSGWLAVLFWDKYTVLRRLAMPTRWYGAISQKNETSFAGLLCTCTVTYISKRICWCESYGNCMAVMLVGYVSSSCPKQHCTVALYLSPFNNLASVLSGCHRVRSEHFFIQCHIGYTIIRKLFFIVLMDTSVHFIFQISGMGVTWGK